MRILISISMLAVSPRRSAAQPAGTGEKLVNESDCSSCHAPGQPDWSDLPGRRSPNGMPGNPAQYQPRRENSGGRFRQLGRRGHDAASRFDGRASQTDAGLDPVSEKRSSGPPAKGAAKIYTYKLKNGSTVNWISPCTWRARLKVTKDVFKGYALYNSYCYRCHGTDATGGELGPDLQNVSQCRNEAADVYVGGYGRQESERHAELGGFPQRGRHDQSVPVCEGAKPRSGAFR